MLASALNQHYPWKSDLRLYDLLAGLSVRTHQADSMASLVTAATTLKARLREINASQRPYEHGPVMTFLYRVSGNPIPAPRARKVPHPKKGKPATSTSRALHTRYLEDQIAARIEKWQDGDSSWHKRWSDPTKKVRWSWSSKAPEDPGFVEIS